ncbi:MAG: orotidine 5'-phosphate decarboxylase [Thermoplasmata archaeon]|nr:orotidine 5'-phosphate decarboxylase [Thermoplasmata archaeon]
MSDRPVLQVALDFIHLERALKALDEAVKGGVDWIEVGTPLIKSEGMDAIRKIKKRYPGHTVVADLKTMDVGGVEVEMASKSGADIVVVMGVSDDGTIEEAVKTSRRYGSKVMVDLMGVEDKAGRAKEAERMGVDYLCVHVSIDAQMIGKKPLQELRKVAKVAGIPVGVAGGMNSETVAQALVAGASIIIVGGAIIKASNVTSAVKGIKEAMLKRKKISTKLHKKYSEDELSKAFMKVSTPNIADAMHKKGVMKGIVPRINHGTKMVGRCLTVKTADGDWAKPVEAIDKVRKGEVIVIDAGGGTTGLWGELASWSCKGKGISGVVIDGTARDIDTILEIDFPVFSRHTSPHAGEPKGHGEIGCEVEVGGQVVRTGDWIVGDESGVMVVPQGDAVETANRALDVLERENRIREEIKRGKTLSSVLELEKWEKVG